MQKNIYNNARKMSSEELQAYIGTMSKGSTHKKKKGAGSYTRKEKHKKQFDFCQ